MPSEIMDSQGLPSSSFLSEDVSFPEVLPVHLCVSTFSLIICSCYHF